MGILPYFSVGFNYLETLAKLFTFLARQNQGIQKKDFSNDAPVIRFAVAMNSNSAFSASNSNDPFR